VSEGPRAYAPAPAEPEFSLMLGGPLFQLLRVAHLADGALTMVRRRIVVIAGLCWLPLFVLSALQGQLIGGSIKVPFLLDVDVHVRFLVALPLLIAAEHLVHQRLRHVVAVFLERGLIPADARPKFDAAVASAVRLRNSVVAELLLIAFVYGVGTLVVWRHYTSLNTATWYFGSADPGASLSRAGLWFGFVALPIFQFMLFRWYFRIAIWARFLWQVSRIPLNLVPMHPDRVGGLGFLSGTAYAFTTLAAAHGAVVAGQIAGRIFFLNAALADFKIEIGVVVVFLLCLAIGPLLVFSAQLARTKRVGLRRFGTLAQRYVREFEAKWLDGGADAGEVFIGSADIQSLADLGNSYEVVKGMRYAPVTRDTVLQLAIATLAPMAPLLLTIMPLEQLLRTLGGAIF
jgi:hypothetical protein